MSIAKNKAKEAFQLLDAQIEANLHCLIWTDQADNFRRLISAYLRWEALDNEPRVIVDGFLESSPIQKQLLENAIYITTVASFEEFCRSTLRGICEEINQKKQPTTSLPDNFRNFLMVESAKFLQKVHSPPNYWTFNKEDLSKSIGTMHKGSHHLLVQPDVLSDISGILNLEQFLKRMSKLLGRQIKWSNLARDRRLQKALGTRQVRETEKELKIFIKQLVTFRNRIAHLGGQAADVSRDIVKEHAFILKALASSVTDHI